jgi:hypothetical protein
MTSNALSAQVQEFKLFAEEAVKAPSLSGALALIHKAETLSPVDLENELPYIKRMTIAYVSALPEPEQEACIE